MVAARVLVLVALVVTGCAPSAAAPTATAVSPTASPAATAGATATVQLITQAPAPTLPPGVVIHPLDAAAGVPLGYIEYVPPGTAAEPRPLLVFLHGSSESGLGNEPALKTLFRQAIPQLIRSGAWPADRPFVVLMPQHDNREISCFTPDEIEGFITRALKQYPVDPKRVYLTGLSCGAIGIWDYLGEHTNEQVAAVVPIAGDGRGAFDAAGCKLGLVPIWAIHGDSDPQVEVHGSIDPITALQACKKPKAIDARLTLYEHVMHDSWSRTYDLSAGNDIYAWMLGHTRP